MIQKFSISNFINNLFLILLLLSFTGSPLLAQENPGSPETETPPKENPQEKKEESSDEEEEMEYEPYFTFAKEESMEKYVNEFPHRLKIRMGVGLGSLSPGILNETGESWLINSFLASGNLGGGYPIAFPINKAETLDTIPQFQEISYGWKNRVDLSFSRDSTLGKYDQGSSAAILLITPRTENYWASGFEGNRLLRFEGRSEHLRLSYTHPVFDFFMIGPSINMHRYLEKNEVSNGSYTTRRSDNVSIWSVGGNVSANYSMKGILPGILMKLQLMPWWEVRSRIELIDRKGNFGIFGAQAVRLAGDSGESYQAIIPVYSGQVRDKGNLLMLETSLRYCRFTLDIGLIRQDVKRSYSSYFGDAYGALSPTDFNAKARGIGLGEMVGSFRHRTQEFYIMPSVSFHFDEDGVY